MAALVIPSWRSGALYSFRILSQGRPHAIASALTLPWMTLLPALPTFQSILDLLPPFLLAVPKKKTSHSRKAMRAANKGLKDKTNIVNCPGCGAAKLAHHLCPECYSSLNRAWKARQKSAEGVGTIQIVEK